MLSNAPSGIVSGGAGIYRFQTKTQLTFAKIDKIPDMVFGILIFFLVYG